jgi:hypothetical protein
MTAATASAPRIMTARVIRLPATPAGKALLREAALIIGGWGRPGGATLEDFDWDQDALELEEMGIPPTPAPRRGGR